MEKLFKDYCCDDTRFNISKTIIDDDSYQEDDSSTVGSICSSIEEEREEANQFPIDELICYYCALTSLEASFNSSLRRQAERFEKLLEETESKVSQKLQGLNALIEEQVSQMKELKEKNNALSFLAPRLLQEEAYWWTVA